VKFRDTFATNIEIKLREELESRGLKWGTDFATQFPIKYGYIIDIAFPDKKIAVEADGEPWHSPKKDATKNYILKQKGWKVLRFPGNKILTDVKGCVDEILRHL